jgi:predicted nucleotidyltransferase
VRIDYELTKNEKILETRMNIGRGGFYAQYFCGK